jgi:hypothetical protein
MTKDEIMTLANQTSGQHWMDEAHIQRFAALVAAAEREACAKVCDYQITRWTDDRARYAAGECAAAIRTRGNP